MLSQDFYNYIQSIPSASAQPNISNQDVINYKLNFPCLEEQTNPLTSFPRLIKKLKWWHSKLNKLRLGKKACCSRCLFNEKVMPNKL